MPAVAVLLLVNAVSENSALTHPEVYKAASRVDGYELDLWPVALQCQAISERVSAPVAGSSSTRKSRRSPRPLHRRTDRWDRPPLIGEKSRWQKAPQNRC